MKMVSHCIGIDVDKKTLKVCLSSRIKEGIKVKGNRTFTNNGTGHKQLLSWVVSKVKKLESTASMSYVLEATGVYHEELAYFLNSKDKVVHIVLPLKAKRYFQSLGIRSKNDNIDAKGLARMGLEQQLEEWHPGNIDLLKLRSITRQIEAFNNQKTILNNQLEAINHTFHKDQQVEKSILKIIKSIETQIAQLELKVKKTIETDEELNDKYNLFKPLKGVGLMTFAVIVAETNGFSLFKNQRQLTCYAGYDIIENQSGGRVGKTRMSKKGNTHIRRALHMASLVYVRCNVPIMKSLWQRVYDRTFIKMKGYVAVQRKLLVLMYSIWKNNEVFDEKYRKSNNDQIDSCLLINSKEPLTEGALSGLAKL